MLEQEFKYYLDHQQELVDKYNGKFVVIVGESVDGVYGSQPEAYIESSKKHALGTFLIQKVSPGNQDYTQTFHSRVIFRSNSLSVI